MAEKRRQRRSDAGPIKGDARAEARAVSRYLEALAAHKPKRGRRKSSDSIQRQINEIAKRIEASTPLRRLTLVQKQMDLRKELESLQSESRLDDFEPGFVEAAPGYGTRKGISYSAWRELGVSVRVLQKAGIGRGRRGRPPKAR